MPHRCFVEIKELAETPDDVAMRHDLQSGKPSFRWNDPGARLRQSIKNSAAQLRKFSHRGFPTVVCFFDTTVGFYLERVHLAQAMFCQETLHFEVSGDPAHDPRFLGMRHGKKATLTSRNNTSISAVAVLRRNGANGSVVHTQQESLAEPVIAFADADKLPAAEGMEGMGYADKVRRSAGNVCISR
jgi:hypothetical protein